MAPPDGDCENAISLAARPGYTDPRNGSGGDGKVRGAISAGDLEKLVTGEAPQSIVAVVLLEQSSPSGTTYTPYLRLSGNPRAWVGIAKWREVGIRAWSDPRRAVDSLRKDYGWAGTSVLLITTDDPLARKLGPAGPFATE
jgi:hypothetical protein